MGTHMIGRCKDFHLLVFLQVEGFLGFRSEEEVLGQGKVQADTQHRQPRRSISFRSISKLSLSHKVCSHLYLGKVQGEAIKLYNSQRGVIEGGRLCF